MGCDIHCYAEVATDEDYGWEMIGGKVFTLDEFKKEQYNREKGESPFFWRAYNMFSILAGVRSNGLIEPISKPKGLPRDVSREVWNKYYNWLLDAHSHSFLTLRELIEYKYDDEFIKFNPLFFRHIEELKSFGSVDDVRIVFWFDN